MSIALSTTKDRAPFGGAECDWISFCQLEFRPSERRQRGRLRPINISPLQGGYLFQLSWRVYVMTSKELAKKEEVMA